MAAGKVIKLFSWIVRLTAFLLLVFGLLAAWQWLGSDEYRIKSKALQETRTYRVFNAKSDGPIVYSLDGQSFRNSLAPAVWFSLTAIFSGRDLPKVIAIHSNANRDNDFRRAQSTPTYWRPSTSGHSGNFDAFLINELQPVAEAQAPSRVRSYLMGHSLSGLYALDLATRKPGQFAGIFAFAPTFSHDTSIIERLPKSCGDDTLIYANWGLESARDTAVFDETIARWTAAPECQKNLPTISYHPGSIHQTIMVTGQIQSAFLLLQ